MKSVTALLAAALLGLLISSSDTIAKGDNLGQRIGAPDTFSYRPPKGWVIRHTNTPSNYFDCIDPSQSIDVAPNISVITNKAAGSLGDFVSLGRLREQSTTSAGRVTIVSEKPFVTHSGLRGVRMVVNETVRNQNLQAINYFFEDMNSEFQVIAICFIEKGTHYAQIFDSSMKTFRANESAIKPVVPESSQPSS